MASANLNSWVPASSSPRPVSSSFNPPDVSGSGRGHTTTALWMALDVATVALLAILAISLRRDTSVFHPGHPTGLGASGWVFLAYLGGFGLVLILISKAYGLYRPMQSLGGLREQRLTIQSCFMASLILAGALYFSHATSISRAVVIATMVSSTVLLCVRRAVWRIYIYRQYVRDIGTRNVLIVGTGPSGQAVRNHLRRIRRLGYSFKGFVCTDHDLARNKSFARTRHGYTLDQSEVLGTFDEIADLARKHFIDEIFITGACGRAVIRDLITQASELGLDVRVFPDLYEGLAVTSPLEYVGHFPTFPLHFRRMPVASLIFKRMLDIVLASLAIFLTLPVLLAVAVAIRVSSSGSVLYRAERVGRKGRIFSCWKFRTMVVNADELQDKLLHMNERDGILFKVKDDPRITPVGRFLRKYSLDELPQLFNVLLGSMSIVGPRPPVAREVSQYKLAHLRRLDVSPGITGLWQVQARQDPSFDQYISLDTFYVDNWSLWLDLKIMVRTFAVVISGTGS